MGDLQTWQQSLDNLAYFNLLAVSNSANPSTPLRDGGKLTGIELRGQGHRLDVSALDAVQGQEFRAANMVGAESSPFSLTCSIMPDDFWFVPGESVPATPIDWTKTQRIAIDDAEFSFGIKGEDSIQGAGAGRTYPIQGADREVVRLAANGMITGGNGALAHCQGLFVLSGLYTPDNDFQLRVSIMIVGPGDLLTTEPLPRIEAVADLPKDVTYVNFSTFHPSVTATEIGTFTPAGLPATLTVKEELRLSANRSSALGANGPRAQYEIGEPTGRHEVALEFSPTSGTGAPDSPSGSYDVESFELRQGDDLVGTIKIANDEIRAVEIPIPGVPTEMVTQMFSGFGPIRGGEGVFAGLQGFQINMGVGTFVPHLLSTLNQLEIADPSGRFRA